MAAASALQGGSAVPDSSMQSASGLRSAHQLAPVRQHGHHSHSRGERITDGGQCGRLPMHAGPCQERAPASCCPEHRPQPRCPLRSCPHPLLQGTAWTHTSVLSVHTLLSREYTCIQSQLQAAGSGKLLAHHSRPHSSVCYIHSGPCIRALFLHRQ